MEQENKVYKDQIYNHPIFSGATAAEFGAFMEKCTINNYEKSERILYSQSPRNGLLLILKGVAEVCVAFHENNKNHEVLEVLERGEIIGFSSLADFLGEPAHYEYPYTVEVRAVEEAVCLHIPYSVMEARWTEEEVRDYVLRQVSVRLRDIYASLAEQVHLANQWGESDPFIQRVQDMMTAPAVKVTSQTRIAEVAEKMVKENASSVVVEKEQQHLAGIITEKDLVQRVVAFGKDGKTTAAEIMSKKPYIITRQAYYYEAMSSFFMNGVKHLPVAEEDDHKKIIGMITLSDLLKKKNRGKFDILQEIESSDEKTLPTVKNAIYDVLANLIQDEIPTLHTLEIVTKLYDRLVRHCVDLALKKIKIKYGEPPAAFAFFLMGSGGRAEQFMLTDQDHFLVYEDPESDKDKERTETYFRALGNEIVYWLERAGYKRCDGNMMASETNWRGKISHWRERLRTWGLRATNENILLGHNFLAFRYIYGDPLLKDEFVRMVHEQLQTSKIFLFRAAEQEKNNPVPTLDHPIRALFRVKKQGIDIKKHALFPFHHSLQILSAKHSIFGQTPLHMITSLKEKSVLSEQTAEDLRFAYQVVLKIRVEQSWNRYMRGEGNSSEIKFTQMKSRDKEELISALKSIRSLQSQTVNTFGMM
ncbi:DUF294 nucleotidyltransferase-like domain-containing protein [Alteribacillus sp. YIM 98480]|uniref:DUF294 nucleotidyltransferase-like domain-containing protein n=1 Tax=Alteribacillus sp. YIM 98480 TaxID=2606599 RepID=UPI00131DD674|nr:DUF294 nucleotidyltransferase-like domain-containing protein [Alteribacillus sp. YIM 98480]